MYKVGISIPVANEEGTIEEFLKSLLQAIDTVHYDFAVYIVMDNFSKDRTFDIVHKMSQMCDIIKTVFYKESTGVVSCYLKGFECALAEGCDFVIEMDSGGSHPPSKIRDMIYALDQERYDVVFMSRFMAGGGMANVPWYRRMISKGGTVLANLWLGMHLTDGTSGFEGFRADVLRSFDLGAFISRGGIYQTEMKYYCNGYKMKEIPFSYRGSTSTFKFQWLLVALKTLVKIKYNKRHVVKTSVAPR